MRERLRFSVWLKSFMLPTHSRFWGKAEKEGNNNKMKQCEKKIEKKIGAEPKRKTGEFLEWFIQV